MLVNECEGGKSVIVDGYTVLRDFRDDCPEYFDILSIRLILIFSFNFRPE